MKSLLLSLLLCATCHAQVTAVIEGPTEVEPGDVFFLDASGSVCETRTWMLAGSNKQLRTFENGNVCVFGTGRAGEYEFILFTAGKDDSGKVLSAASKHIVKVLGSTPPAPVPVPDPPVVPPPGPAPPAPLTGVALRAFTAVKGLTTTPDEVRHFAASMRTAAGNDTVEAMALAYRQQLASGPFARAEVRQRWESFANGFVVREFAETRDVAQARLLYGEIASGLERSLTTSVGAAVRESLRQRKDAVEGAVESLEAEIGIR